MSTSSTTAKRPQQLMVAARAPNSNKKLKRDFSFLLGPQNGSIKCTPCDPNKGLAIGGRPITVEELNHLPTEDLNENPVTRNGKELSMEEFASLLNMPPEFAQMLTMMEDVASECGMNDGR